MAAKMSCMQSVSQASELTIKNVKDVIALHERRSENDTLQQHSIVDLQKH